MPKKITRKPKIKDHPRAENRYMIQNRKIPGKVVTYGKAVLNHWSLLASD